MKRKPNHPDAAIIDQLGGAAAVVKRLKLTEPDARQRVQNWKRRGIPAAVRLEHLKIFGRGA